MYAFYRPTAADYLRYFRFIFRAIRHANGPSAGGANTPEKRSEILVMLKSELLDEITQSQGYPYNIPAELSSLFFALIQTHEDMETDMEQALAGVSSLEMLGAFLVDIPIFHYSYLYEILDCNMSSSHVRMSMSRLIKKTMAKNTTLIKSSDKEVSSVFYLTKGGYHFLSGRLMNCCPYRGKNGQRLSETAMHDLGVGAAYLSFVRSPFVVEPIYEMTNMFDKVSAPAGRFLRQALRPDAILSYHSDLSFGKIYVEHDTGHESVARMMDKLNLYVLHGVMNASSNGATGQYEDEYECNAILYTYRKQYKQRPSCFGRIKLQHLIDALPEGVTVDAFETEDGTISELLAELRRWTPAFRKHWGKEELKAFAKNVHNSIEPSFIRYQRYYQRAEAAKRRNSAFKLLIREFHRRDRSEYATAISEMLNGFPVWFCPYNHVTNALPSYFMQDYPRVITWLENVLMPYYGEVTYISRQKRFPNPNGGRELTLSNIFEDKKGTNIAVEYISCDLSALLRLYVVCKGEYDVNNSPFNLILLVDSYKDANDIMDLCEPLFKAGSDRLFRGGVLDIAFLSLTGNYLFSLTPDGREVKLVG